MGRGGTNDNRIIPLPGFPNSYSVLEEENFFCAGYKLGKLGGGGGGGHSDKFAGAELTIYKHKFSLTGNLSTMAMCLVSTATKPSERWTQ